VLEDAPAGLAAARAAGMRVIGVLTTHTRDELAAADAFARDLGEVHELLAV
jgi:sugar-phosphatase